MKLIVLLLVLLQSVHAESAADGFMRMQELLGSWEAKTPRGAIIKVSYRMVSKGSALVESYLMPSGDETLTIFHPDGTELLATHYCAQGNQPRLRYQPESSTRTDVTFSYFDATNLRAPGASHLTKLRFRLLDADHFEKTEIYTEAGKDDTTVLKFVRVGRLIQ